MLLVLIFSLLLRSVLGQEAPQDYLTSYNVGPYKHVYPPVNVSVDQKSCSPDAASNRTCPLFVALLMSFGGAFTSSGVVPGLQVALDQINSDPSILPGYTLHYTLKDSQCDRTTALDSLHSEIIQPPTKIAVIGSGCSVATEPTAEVSHYYNLTQLSCVSSSTELTNRKRFPKHFQMSTAEISLAYGFFGVIQTFKWRKVSIIAQDESLFILTMNELKRLLSDTDVAFTEFRFETDIGIDRNPFILDPDGRIFVLSMYANHAREILCMAYNVSSDFKYPRNLFFVNGWYSEKWWIGTEAEQAHLIKKYNCNASHRESLLPSTLAPATSGRVVLNYSAVADNGFTGADIQHSYQSYLNASLLNVTENFLYQLCYDTAWTLALALNGTLSDIHHIPSLQDKLNGFLDADNGEFGLQHFTYDNDILVNNIFGHLSSTNFNGIVGNISFDANGGRRIDTVELLQYRYDGSNVLRATPVGSVVRRSDLHFQIVYRDNIITLWSDGVPYDGVPTEEMVTIHLSLTVIISILATCGTVFAIVCIALNTHFRNTKLIRLTSPKLNNLIGVGAVILYVDMYLFVVPTTSQDAISVLCNLDTWLTAIGYSLCYGTILAKMCRVYYIFRNPGIKKKGLKDWMLAIFVLFLVIIDFLILLTYTISQGVSNNLSAERVPNRENPEDTLGVLQEVFRYYTFVCISRQRYITLGILYGYKALLQIVALIFAVSIRKIRIKGLNDAVYIISAIYVTSIVTAVVVVSTYTLTELINVYAAVFSFCFFIGTTVILVLVFIPPLVSLWHDPEGKQVFDARNSSVELSKNIELTSCESENSSLRQRIKQLEMELAASKIKTEEEKIA